MRAKIVVLPGDGIGPEVTEQAQRVLQAVAKRAGHAFEFDERLMGGCSIDRHGTALTDEDARSILAFFEYYASRSERR